MHSLDTQSKRCQQDRRVGIFEAVDLACRETGGRGDSRPVSPQNQPRKPLNLPSGGRATLNP